MPASSAPILVRPAIASDLDAVAALDAGFSTDYVWQMEFVEEERNTQVSFREVRLPRSMRVPASRSVAQLLAHWTDIPLFIVAETENRVHGYLAVANGTVSDLAVVTDCTVARRARRRGIGTAMLSSAIDWAARSDHHRLIVETQSKNYPAISFCRKRGLVFCGYNDRYYPNQDIALFFGVNLK
ncbi:MAG: GNAT family N-acetyltransferase [Anaerolineales bacterium]